MEEDLKKKGVDQSWNLVAVESKRTKWYDQGESSTYRCSICRDYVPSPNTVRGSTCSHHFCLDCLGPYIGRKLPDNILKVECPEPICNAALTPAFCRRFIPLEVFLRWAAARQDARQPPQMAILRPPSPKYEKKTEEMAGTSGFQQLELDYAELQLKEHEEMQLQEAIIASSTSWRTEARPSSSHSAVKGVLRSPSSKYDKKTEKRAGESGFNQLERDYEKLQMQEAIISSTTSSRTEARPSSHSVVKSQEPTCEQKTAIDSPWGGLIQEVVDGWKDLVRKCPNLGSPRKKTEKMAEDSPINPLSDDSFHPEEKIFPEPYDYHEDLVLQEALLASSASQPRTPDPSSPSTIIPWPTSPSSSSTMIAEPRSPSLSSTMISEAINEGISYPEGIGPDITEDLYEEWHSILRASRDLALRSEKKLHCPFRDCLALLTNAGLEFVTASECPNCGRLICAQCKVPWHEGMDCEEFQRLNDFG